MPNTSPISVSQPPSVSSTNRCGGSEDVAGIKICGTPTLDSWIGGVNPAGQSVQGALMFARTVTGSGFFAASLGKYKETGR
jgi:hypothetical protein